MYHVLMALPDCLLKKCVQIGWKAEKNSNIPRYPEIKTYGTTMVHLPSAGNSGRRQRTIEARHVGPVTILGAIQHIHESEL